MGLCGDWGNPTIKFGGEDADRNRFNDHPDIDRGVGLGQLEVEGVNLAQLDYLKRLEAIRDDLIEDRKESKTFLDHITEAIRMIEGGGDFAIHPDLPTEPPPAIKKQTYINLTTTSSVLNVLGKAGQNLIDAREVMDRLLDGGWGDGLKDPLASTRACLSGMGRSIKVEKIGGINHYGLLPVEET